MVSQVFKVSDWPNSNVGGCVGGLSQVFKASDWPNSNLKDYKRNVSCYLCKVALSDRHTENY